jgi:hypothetical protein
MAKCSTPAQALAFVQQHGIVLVSAKGSVPRLTEAIVGEFIKGSWWAHPKSHQIIEILGAVTDSDQVLVCKLIDGKVTLVHRRLWPSLVRLADRLTPEQLAQVRHEHTPSGKHVNHLVPFPQWVPADVMEQAKTMSEEEVLTAIGAWLPSSGPAAKRGRAKS